MLKEIQKIKLALTTDCVLNCNHCRIDKSARMTMPYEYAEKGIRMLLDSPGRQKRLELYGGEPFLKYDLMKKCVRFAREYSAERNKLLSISIATNGLLIDKEKTDFLKENRINLSISVSGSKENHDLCRIFPDGHGSWDALEPKIEFMLREMNHYDIVALECVAPDGAFRLLQDMRTLVAKGFKVINVECVHGMDWSDGQLDQLASALQDFADYLFDEIRRGNFVIPEPFIEFFRVGGADTPIFCPMYRDLEMYPDGNLSFYPFAFLHYEESREQVRIGTAENGLFDKYLDCEQNKDEEQCENCVSSYYRIPGLTSGAEAYSLRTSVLKKIFLEVLRLSKKEKIFAEYAKFLAMHKKREYKDYSMSN